MGDTEHGDKRREPRLRDIARRIFREDDGEAEGRKGDGVRVEARELIGAVLETGDKAKTEIVRMVARELRSYLEALELHKDLLHLMTSYSLEVHGSFHLKPLDEDSPPSSAGVSLRPTEAQEPAAEE